MNFFTHIFKGFLLDSKLLFIMLYLGIIPWKGVLCFNEGGGCFSVLVGVFSKKIVAWDCVTPHVPSTMGNPIYVYI